MITEKYPKSKYHHFPPESKDKVRCAVKDCQSYSDQKPFVGGLCPSCYRFVSEKIDPDCSSQAARNALELAWSRIKKHVDAQLKKTRQQTSLRAGASIAITWDRSLLDLIKPRAAKGVPSRRRAKDAGRRRTR